MSKYSTALSSLIQSVAMGFDDLADTPQTPTGGYSTTTLACTSLTRGDNYYNGMQIHFYSGTHKDTTREVTDWVLSTSTLTFPAVTAATDVSDLFQLHRMFTYNQYKDAVNRAIEQGKMEYLLNKKDDTAVQNRLTNWDFEVDVTGWTVTGAGASAAVSTTRAEHGAQSYKFTVGAADAYSYQIVSNGSDYRGKEMTFRCWVWASAASQTYIAVNDGVTIHKSDYHTGSSTWELLSITFTVEDEGTTIQARLGMLAGAGSAYFDMPILLDTDYYELTMPTGFQRISEIWCEGEPESTNFDTKIPSKDWWIVKDATTPLIRFTQN